MGGGGTLVEGEHLGAIDRAANLKATETSLSQ